jgi:lysophospholipid acyltransferase
MSIDDGGIEKLAREEAKREGLVRQMSYDSVSEGKRAPTLGLPEDPEAEIDEIVAEVKKEIEDRKRRGSTLQNYDVRRAIAEKFKEFKKEGGSIGAIVLVLKCRTERAPSPYSTTTLSLVYLFMAMRR